MLIPRYWAEAVLRHRARNRQVTIRRFGWSQHSVEEAQQMADSRAAEALRQRLAGDEGEPARELKVAYNGSEGVPIREEILETHGEQVITRNGYGARCLNSPDVLFIDVDYDRRPQDWARALLVLLCGALALLASRALGWGLFSVFIALLLGLPLASMLAARLPVLQRVSEPVVLRALKALLAEQPALNFRLYRTPAGLRLLETSRRHDPASTEVAALFQRLHADPLYARMCQRQQCFRARLSAKPWRAGIARHIRPRTAVWPLTDEQLQRRQAWVESYERAAARHAACHYWQALGSGQVDGELRAVMRLHDEQCGALSQRPLA